MSQFMAQLMAKLQLVLIVHLLMLSAGCRSALPAPQPQKEFTKSASDASFAAERAAAALAECKAERARSEELLAEMRVLASQARNAELKCEAMKKAVITRPKTRVIKHRGAPKKPVVVEKPVVEPPKPVEPEYSPSDAPIPSPAGQPASASPSPALPSATLPASSASATAPAPEAPKHDQAPAGHAGH